jgi:hypothetical protein
LIKTSDFLPSKVRSRSPGILVRGGFVWIVINSPGSAEGGEMVAMIGTLLC